MHWQRLRSLQGGGVPTALPRRCLAARALSTNAAAVKRLLEGRQWLLPDPAVQVTQVQPEGLPAGFAVIRDDLTHPLIGGNKWRKLDGLWPQLEQATDIITCGGLQSAHTLAVAAAAAEHGKRAHLLVRGERPAVPTGSHLYARMLAHRTVYVSRAEYANRAAMFRSYLERLRHERQGAAVGELYSGAAAAVDPAAGAAAGSSGAAAGAGADEWEASHGVAVIPEGAAGPGALLGLIRQLAWLAGSPQSPLASSTGGNGSSAGSSGRQVGNQSSTSSSSSSGGGERWHLVVDSGTGATATGLALGAALLGLPWRVTGTMLAGTHQYYQQQQLELVAAFCREHGGLLVAADAAAASAAALEAEAQAGVAARLRWVPRLAPRKFGRVLPGEVEQCRAVAQHHGILLDPIWNLAAWEAACQLAVVAEAEGSGERVAMLHTGGHLGLCGLAQRWPDQF